MWKSVIVRSVAKVASPSCPRPITIVSLLSKGFDRLINGQVLAHVDRSGFLSEFRCGHSTTTALGRVIEDLRSSMTEGRVTVLVLLDFSKAFDCVDYHLFLHKLVSSFDFHGSARDMVSTFGWCQIVLPCLVFRCALGFCTFTTFFSMFVNCLSEYIRHSRFHFYTDDLIQIYLSGNRSDLDGLIARVNEDLEAIHRWSIENGLLLNPTKSQTILVSKSPPELPLCSCCFWVILRWIIAFGLDAMSRRSAGVFSTLHILRLLKFLTPKSIPMKLCKALLLPHFFYYNIVFSSLSCLDGRRLQVAFNIVSQGITRYSITRY
jgi:hypothetical protein